MDMMVATATINNPRFMPCMVNLCTFEWIWFKMSNFNTFLSIYASKYGHYAQAMACKMHKVGFFTIVGHGIDASVINNAFGASQIFLHNPSPTRNDSYCSTYQLQIQTFQSDLSKYRW
jgi:hypothetical protein